MTAHGRVSEEDEVTDMALPTNKLRALDIAVHRALWPETEVVLDENQRWVYAQSIAQPGEPSYPPEELAYYSDTWTDVPILLDRVRELGWGPEVSQHLTEQARSGWGMPLDQMAPQDAVHALLWGTPELPEQICRAIVVASEEAGRE